MRESVAKTGGLIVSLKACSTGGAMVHTGMTITVTPASDMNLSADSAQAFCSDLGIGTLDYRTR